jgi:hypothetical protein
MPEQNVKKKKKIILDYNGINLMFHISINIFMITIHNISLQIRKIYKYNIHFIP